MHHHPTDRLRWKIRLDTILHPTSQSRANDVQQRFHPRLLHVPSNELTKQHFRLAEENGLNLDPYRFDSLDLFTSLAARASITEAA